MLKKITIEHYRSCRKTSFDCHPQLSVLIGPNASGKTNVIQGIMLLNKLAQGDGFERHRTESATLTARLSAIFDVKGQTANLNATLIAFTDDSNNDVLVSARNKWKLQNQEGQRISTEFPLGLPFRAGKDSFIMSPRAYHLYPHWGARSMQKRLILCGYPPDIKPWGFKLIGEVAQFCSGMRYYGASQFTNPGTCPVSFEIEKEGGHSRPWRLRGHSRTLYDLYVAQKGSSQARYSQFLDTLVLRVSA